MTALNERVAKLETSVESVACRIESLETRLWWLGLLVVAGSNSVDAIKLAFF
jgi:hypothetical protein